MAKKQILLDIMLNGKFVCQLKYDGEQHPEILDGRVVYMFDGNDIERFVYEKRPSFVNRDIRIRLSDQKA